MCGAARCACRRPRAAARARRAVALRLLVAGDSGAAGVGAPTQERALLSGPAPVSSPTMEFKDHYKTLGVERVFAAM